MFGYTAADPARVYRDIVSTYRVLRVGAHANASLVSPVVQNMEFSEWMDRVVRARILPEWWDAKLHGAGIETYAREDEWGRLDRVMSREEIRDSLDKPHRIEMIVERIVNTE